MSDTLNDNFQLRADIAQYMQSTPRNSAAWTAAGALHTALRDGLRQVALDIRPWEITEPLEKFSERAESLGLTITVAPPVYASPGRDAVSPNGSRQGVASQTLINGRQRETASGEQAHSYAARQNENPPQTEGPTARAVVSSRDALHAHGSPQTEKSQAQNVAEREAIARALRMRNRASRSRTVSTHISPEERSEIEQQISESGLDLSAFVREAICEKLRRKQNDERTTLVLYLNGEQFTKICQMIAAESRQQDETASAGMVRGQGQE